MESDFRLPLKITKIDNKEVNAKMKNFSFFFQRLYTNLEQLTIEETLGFQASVLTMLQKIKK